MAATRPPPLCAIAGYILGRTMLLGICALMLTIVSGVVSAYGRTDYFSNSVLVLVLFQGFSFLRWLALRETLSAGRFLRVRLVTGPIWVLLAIFLGSFHYGFWWSRLSGEETTRTELGRYLEEARDAAQVVAAKLDSARVHINIVVTHSSCAGRGPPVVRDSILTLRDSLTRSWLTPVQGKVERLRQAAKAGRAGRTIDEREVDFEDTTRKIRGLARDLAASGTALGAWAAKEMRAVSKIVAATGPGFACAVTLADLLEQGATQAAQPVELNLPDPVFNEGPAGVKSAVDRVWANLRMHSRSIWAYLLSGGKARVGPGEKVEPMSGRDLIALLATLGIELGLLVLVVINPPRNPPQFTPVSTL